MNIFDEGYEYLLEDIIALNGRMNKSIDEWSYTRKTGLGDQLSRSLTSVSSNLEEGRGRAAGCYGYKDVLQFMRYALGSAREAKVQIKIAWRSGLIGRKQKTKSVQILEDAIVFIEKKIDEMVEDRYENGDYD